MIGRTCHSWAHSSFWFSWDETRRELCNVIILSAVYVHKFCTKRAAYNRVINQTCYSKPCWNRLGVVRQIRYQHPGGSIFYLPQSNWKHCKVTSYFDQKLIFKCPKMEYGVWQQTSYCVKIVVDRSASGPFTSSAAHQSWHLGHKHFIIRRTEVNAITPVLGNRGTSTDHTLKSVFRLDWTSVDR